MVSAEQLSSEAVARRSAGRAVRHLGHALIGHDADEELLTNVVRHANAKQVTARLYQQDGRAVLSVTDDGRGITAEERAGHTSLGLLGVRERAAALGGTFEIWPRAEGGTVATVTIPVGAP